MLFKFTLLLALAVESTTAALLDVASLKPNAQCTVNTTTSQLFGGNTGNAFNDIVARRCIGPVPPCDLLKSDAIDGIAFAYSQGRSGQLVTIISHGTSITAPVPGNTTFPLNENDSIISVTGVSGGGRVQQINFEILDSSTGTRLIAGCVYFVHFELWRLQLTTIHRKPLGSGPCTAFNVTGKGLSSAQADSRLTQTSLGGSATIQVCSSVNTGCVDLPVVSASCINLDGGLSFVNKEISFTTIPGGFICTFFRYKKLLPTYRAESSSIAPEGCIRSQAAAWPEDSPSERKFNMAEMPETHGRTNFF
ncbi:hypothetical protein FB451DRAFT_1492067 [Mycena latifolia]|nr:hypothetical protein FB451DRAFT_1492067 [Mycena latifolia]